MSPALLAALGAGAILFLLAGFHAALALGAPWGRFAWGGRHDGALPARLQLGSALTVPALLGMGLVLLIRAGALYPQWSAGMEWPAWGAFLFLVMNAFGALSSASGAERRLMGPVWGLAGILAGVVAFG